MIALIKLKNNFIKLIYFILLMLFCFNLQAKKLPEFYLGKANAPVTLYSFMSLSCPHCAEEFKILNKDFKSKYIDSGKVKLVILDFPIRGSIDVLAHSLLYYSNNNEQFFKLVNLFLSNQESWVMAPDPKQAIINYGKLAGISNNKIKEFENDKSIPDQIIKNANTIYIKKYGINATPTLIVEKTGVSINKNSKKFVGLPNQKELENTVNNLLKNVK